jgi:hypothetical protein
MVGWCCRAQRGDQSWSFLRRMRPKQPRLPSTTAANPTMIATAPEKIKKPSMGVFPVATILLMFS